MSSEELLFTDIEGSMVGLDGVIADGLDRDYSARFPALRTLLEQGAPAERLHACIVLASWGVRDGLLTIVEWAAAPDRVPWAGAPVSFDRMFGLDDAFAQLARALDTARAVELTPVGVRLRVAATRALLRLHHRAFFDRWFGVLLGVDDVLTAAVRPQIREALEMTVAACRKSPVWDLPTQAALLLGPLATFDDDLAASFATQLTFIAPDWPRTLQEVACAMGSGRGPATRYVLQRLADSAHTAVAKEAREWMARREAADG